MDEETSKLLKKTVEPVMRKRFKDMAPALRKNFENGEINIQKYSIHDNVLTIDDMEFTKEM